MASDRSQESFRFERKMRPIRHFWEHFRPSLAVIVTHDVSVRRFQGVLAHRKLRSGMALKFFFRFSLAYLGCALVLVSFIRNDVLAIIVGAYMQARNLIPELAWVGLWLAFIACLPIVLLGARDIKSKAVGASYAFAGIVMFHLAFTMVKTTFPFVVPFYADPFLADFDRWLHGRVDPWVHVYAWDNVIPIGSWVSTYMSVWFVPALAFPLILCFLDNDAQRVRRYSILYILAWVFIGNVLATIGSSVGPVYYDRVFGGDRFAELQEALANGAVSMSAVASVQDFLWRMHEEHGQAFGSGISAFPSVHVSTTVVFCLYLVERAKLLAPFAALYLAKILVMSVYTGYHYAIDGYVSILVMVAAWAWLSRRASRRDCSTDEKPVLDPALSACSNLVSPAE